MIANNLRDQLEPESLRVARTADWLLEQFSKSGAELDFSPIIILTFKILEVEVRQKVFAEYGARATRSARVTAPPFEDQYGRKIEALGSFLHLGKPISLGEMMLVLMHLSSVHALPDGSAYSQLKAYMRDHFRAPHYFFGKERLAERISEAIVMFRNPAVHGKTFDRHEYESFHNLAFGAGRKIGFANSAIHCLRPSAAGAYPASDF